jgi:GDP-D-mannose 3',5'-epimerase
MKHVLVCGAGGFIGSHLVSHLKYHGYYVYGVDLKYNEFKHSDADEFIIADLTLDTSIERIFSSRKIDEIYQLAADMGGAQYIFTGEHDSNVMYNSCKINLNILHACVKYKVPKIFYSSSACIYPEHNQMNPDDPNCSEDSAYPANPDSEYGWEKLFSERMYMAFHRNHGLEVHIARFHNIFGEYGTWQGGKEKAPAAICRKVLLADKSIEIIGTGKQTRSFLYISECIDGIMRLMNSDFSGPVNIGSTEMISINDFTKMIIDISGKHLEIQNISGPVGVQGRNSDNKLIYEKLGWKPSQSLRIGIEQTFKWIKSQIEKQEHEQKNISIIGCAGRVGTCLGLCLEHAGFNILGCDINEHVINQINNKTFSSPEPHVDHMLKHSKNLTLTSSLQETLKFSDFIFIIVPTPNGGGDNFYDHTILSNVLCKINEQKIKNKHIIICCTVKPLYVDNYAKLLLEDCYNITISYSPFFIAQNTIVHNFFNPDIVLLGCPNKDIEYKLANIYLKMCKNTPIICGMQPLEAEVVKIATNNFLSNKISHANLIGDICTTLNIDANVVCSAVGSDSRINSKFFKPGWSPSGDCIPRDGQMYALFVKQCGIETTLISSVHEYSEYHSKFMANELHKKQYDEYIFTDVTYKENCKVPIITYSPKLIVGKYLTELGNLVIIRDKKNIIDLVKKEYGNIFKYEIIN